MQAALQTTEPAAHAQTPDVQEAPKAQVTRQSPQWLGSRERTVHPSAQATWPTGQMQVVHAILLHTGKVLCIDMRRIHRLDDDKPDIVLFDPDPCEPVIEFVGKYQPLEDPNGHNLFCS